MGADQGSHLGFLFGWGGIQPKTFVGVGRDPAWNCTLHWRHSTYKLRQETVYVSLAILNSSTIDFLVTLVFMEFICTWRQPVRIIWYLKTKPSLLLGKLKLASKTNQFCAQNNVNMKWIQKQSVRYIYIPVNHKCLHLYQIKIHFNTHQHA